MGAADVTELVHAAGNGDEAARQALFHAVYAELKRLARGQLAGRANSTINTTGLVHETYIKLIRPESLRLNDRGHFFATAARAMRQIVIDHARRRRAEKRGGIEAQIITVTDNADSGSLDPETLVHLDDALARLQKLDMEAARLVELRFFAGLSVEQVAELRGVSPRTVLRDWRRARAFLFESLHPAAG